MFIADSQASCFKAVSSVAVSIINSIVAHFKLWVLLLVLIPEMSLVWLLLVDLLTSTKGRRLSSPHSST